MKDYYKILGVRHDATKKEITSAYRKLAKEYHPDKPTGNTDKFKEINDAYEHLTKPQPQQNSHTTYREYTSKDFQDIFSDFFSHNFNGAFSDNNVYTKKRYQVGITLEEAFNGTTINGIVISPGTRNGEIKRKQSATSNTVEEYIFIYQPHPVFTPEGVNNLVATVAISYIDCIIGCQTSIKTICGKDLKIDVPENSSERTVLKVKGYGMNYSNRRGDLYIKIHPILPMLTDKQKDILRKL